MKLYFITQNCDREITGLFRSLEELSSQFSYMEEASLENLKSKKLDKYMTQINWDLFITKYEIPG